MRSAFFVFAGLVLACAKNLALADPVDWPTLSLIPVVTNGFSLPTTLTHAGDGSQRLFVEEQRGRIRIIQNSNVLTQPFLDISNRVLSVGAEQGLLGLAFPPGYSTNHHFYVDYTRQPDGATVISRFSLTGNPNLADPNSERVILVVTQANDIHNGGQIAFGPDGYLYIGKGDGGPEADPDNNAQNTKSLLGKLLRIDVENGATTYRIPTNNPFVGNANYAPEIWARGLRNPWRFSFDRQTGDLYIGDVGQGLYEEVDFQPAGSGGGQNYGWNIMEAWANFVVPAGFTNFSALTLPVTWYEHPVDVGGAIAGGYVYRGPSQARMKGIYFFGDFEAGWIGGLKQTGTNWQQFKLFQSSPRWYFTTFGEDDQGELYVANYYPGSIYRIQDAHKVWTPIFQADYLFGMTNAYAYSNTVNITCATPNATVHYTANGINPTESDPIVPAPGISVVDGTTYKARAFRADLTPSDIATVLLTLKVATPVFSPLIQHITNNTPIAISTVTPGAQIYYTTNPYPTPLWYSYSGEVIVSGVMTLGAMGVASGYATSEVAWMSFSPAQVAPLTINPSYGTFTGAVTVTISCPTPGSLIYYTLDDSPPTTNSPVYAAPFVINRGAAIRAFATAPGYVDSAVTRVFLGLVDYKFSSVITPFAGSGQQGMSNAFAPFAQFSAPAGICLDRAGNLYVSDQLNNRIRKITTDRFVSTFAGSGVAGFQDGPAATARFSGPIGICSDPSGNIYVADTGNNRIRKIDTNGMVLTFAGSGIAGVQDGSATNAQFNIPHFLDFDHSSNLYVGQPGRIRKISPDGVVSTIHPSVVNNFYNLSGDLGVAVDASDDVYVACERGGIFQIPPVGAESLFAGQYNGDGGYNDGPRSAALFTYSYNDIGGDAAVDKLGNLYICDGSILRIIDSTGWVSTFAGYSTRGTLIVSGNIGFYPHLTGLCVDTNGNVYVAVTENNWIRKISPDSARIGIADDWQVTHFGYVGIDPTADPDHDGQSNFAEFWAGTDPLNANSRFAITSVTLQTSNTANITWQSVPGKNYAVMFSTNLLNWVTLTNSILATGSSVSYIDATVAVRNSQRFYRVSVNF